ncbi:MAG: phosphopentomutase [bacterium JZ-2024 1]
MIQRVFLIVLDGVGVGPQWDSEEFGDSGSNTLGNTAGAVGGLHLPVLQNLGLGNIAPIKGVSPVDHPCAAFGKAREVSAAKDTLTGHSEILCAPRFTPPRVYPNGFPDEIVAHLREIADTDFLGNRPASGTVILEEEGQRHLASGKPILYTSADSVMQIAVHIRVMQVSQLYDLCARIASENEKQGWVDRVIARPFDGEPGAFRRLNQARRDFTAPPPSPTALDTLLEAGLDVIGVGKIPDIMGHRGFSRVCEGGDNSRTFEVLRSLIKEKFHGLAVLNFNDFDTVYGHRNDPRGFAECLENWDNEFGRLMQAFQEDDLAILTADHGNDPTTPSTDHSREAVPVIAYGVRATPAFLGYRETFADIGATICQLLSAKRPRFGVSFASLLGLG